jgi:GNAT superfamily N-acetyltransferase
MPRRSPKPILASLELRRLLPEEYRQVAAFYREAGYPAAIKPEDIAWGAWSGPALVGCISLCPEEGVWVLRGPEVQFEYRRHGVGRMLLDLVKPEVATRTCYCLAYVYLTGLYAVAGFRPS